MRQFLKFMFASMLGTFLIGIVLLFLFIGSLAALGSSFASKGKRTTVKANSVLHLSLDGEIQDRGGNEPFDFDLGPFQAQSPTGLNTILECLENAKTDDHVKLVFLDLGNTRTGFATLREIRKKLLEFKEASGKPIVAFSDSYTQATYYLATAADEIYLQPKGDLAYTGLQSEYMFLKGLFEKLDIDMQFIRGSNNKFKSFGEVYTEERMSPANREQVRRILNGLWAEHLAAVSAKTGHDADRLNAIADGLLVRNADNAFELGMVDGLLQRDEVLDILREHLALETGKKIQYASLRQYSRSFDRNKGQRGKEKVAIIYAEGSIMTGKSSDGNIGGTSLSETIREAREDSSIKAIVLRVNSPGGSGLASDIIWREVKLAREVKPVVVSMGNVAASGGYYIAAPATRIFAEPTTITGSIGVFGIIPNMQGFFNKKLGITFDGEKTHRYADLMSVNRPLRDDERRIIQQWIDEFYQGFTERVAEGRNMSLAQVDSVGQGRVWTGTDALAIGLVDELGGLEDAVKAAAEMADLDDYRRVELPRQTDFLEQIMKDLNSEMRTWAAAQFLGEDAKLLLQFKRAQEATRETGIMARMPFDLIIE
ncbi:MAG: signal peptide peptidase SppA [Flavobacteriales bacterium]|nr:signal peptide peptidase SppA [Flavobacteriales bacterium]